MFLPSTTASLGSPSRQVGNPHILFLEKTREHNSRTIRWFGNQNRIAPFLLFPSRDKHWSTHGYLRCPCIQSVLLLLSLLPQPALRRYPCETKDQDHLTDTPQILWTLGRSEVRRFLHSVWRSSDELSGNPSMQRWRRLFWKTSQSADWQMEQSFRHPKLLLKSRREIQQLQNDLHLRLCPLGKSHFGNQ